MRGRPKTNPVPLSSDNWAFQCPYAVAGNRTLVKCADPCIRKNKDIAFVEHKDSFCNDARKYIFCDRYKKLSARYK